MPLAKIDIRPGITTELTPTKNEGGFSSAQLIRFFANCVQKLGGWARLAGVTPMTGICRGLIGWADLLGNPYLGAGTDQFLYVVAGGVLVDVTPRVATRNITPQFSTQAGSRIVTVRDTGYSPAAGDWLNLPTQVAIGGIVLFGQYQVTNVIDPNNYQVMAASPAVTTTPLGGAVPAYTTTNTSPIVRVALAGHGLGVGADFNAAISTTVATVVISGHFSVASVIDGSNFTINALSSANANTTASENGGNVRIEYLLPVGATLSSAAAGWGIGDWGANDYGVSGAAGTTSPLINRPRIWSLDHFGQDMVASPDRGAIYHWAPPTLTPAVVVSGSAPTINTLVFCMSEVQMIIAAGTDVSGTHFPTLIRWCDSGDFTVWVASSINQAGSFQLPTGSYITAAIATGLGALIWTDVDLYSMTYQGLPFVFSFHPIGRNCEALSKKAPAVIGNLVVWPSARGFFRYDGGGVVPMECPVWDFFYNNLNLTQAALVCSGTNTLFNEVIWFFPKLDGGIGYVKWNYLEAGSWDYGTMDRTAWIDHSAFGNPIGADSTGLLQEHEVSPDADGLPMTSYAETGYFDIGDGTEMTTVRVLIPDLILTEGSTAQLTVLATDYPGQPPRSYGPFQIISTTRQVNLSLRARQIAFRIGSTSGGSFWRLGAVRYSWSPAGRRP